MMSISEMLVHPPARASWIAASARLGPGPSIRWQCASLNPGSNARPARSTTSAPGATAAMT
jgi:hypothetical protein